MFATKTNISVSKIWQTLGTFYTFLSAESKAVLTSYWSALFEGVEALYYNLAQSATASDLNLSQGFNEHTFQEWLFIKEDLEIKRVESPVITSITNTPSADDEIYSYKVTAVDDSGETPASEIPYILISGGTNLATNPNTINWGAVSGANSYNVYGRRPNEFLYMGNTTGLTFEDDDEAQTTQTPPDKNTTIFGYLYIIPNDEFFATVPTLSGLYTETVLQENIDYTVSGLRIIEFLNPTSVPDTEIYYTNQAVSILPILTNIYLPPLGEENYPHRILEDYNYKPHTEDWSSYSYTEQRTLWSQHIAKWAHAVRMSLIKGPTMRNLKKTMNLFLNLPFSYEDGTVTDITTAASQHTITISGNSIQIYQFPDTFDLELSVTDEVNQFDILCSGISLYDYIADYDRIYSLVDGATYPPAVYYGLEVNIPDNLKTLSYSTRLYSFFDTVIPPGLTTIYTN